MYTESTLDAPKVNKPDNKSAKIYQLIWRWHFWAGLLVSPILIIVAITGALYVFKDEIERFIHSGHQFVEPMGTPVPPSVLETKITEELPGSELHYIDVSKHPDKAWFAYVEFHNENGTEDIHYVFFDQYRGEILHHYSNDRGFFRVVLDIHRRLLSGTFGRSIIEIATCWGIVSVLSGLYLWWPRKKEKIKGVWIPRTKGSFRSRLRDWHTVPAVYISVYLLAIMLTGLFFTNIWGTAFKLSNAVTGGFPDFYLSPPKSAPVEDHNLHTRITLEDAWQAANQAYPFEGRGYGIDLPHHDTDDAFNITTDLGEPFAELGATYIDQYTGKVLLAATSDDLPWQSKVILLFYPIHVGSIFGLGTKIVAFISCLVLIALCSTGVWMWWRRRPSGKIGAPKKTPSKTAPKWMAWLTIALAIFLPTVGITLILFALFHWLAKVTSQNQGPEFS